MSCKVHRFAPTGKIPHFMISFLFICSRHEAFGIFIFCAMCNFLMPYRVHEFFTKLFQVGACPNLKDSSFYVAFSVDIYKAGHIQYLSLFCVICYSLMPCKIHRFGKRRISS